MQDGNLNDLPRTGLTRLLESLKKQGRFRQPLHPERRGPPYLEHQGVRLLDFTSNDYLGLSFHPACILAATQAVRAWGCGAGASKAVTGDTAFHGDLERRLSQWLGEERSLLFATGYQANVGVISALADPDTVIYSDERNHASIVDGCRLSRAAVRIMPHGDVSWLEAALRDSEEPKRIIVTDSLFSMDGHLAPLRELHGLAREHGALLVVDEAHSIGVLGPNGQGLSAAAGIQPDVRIVTFSKALGSQGAAACADSTVAEVLFQRARPLIYSTALPPLSLGATLAALRIAQGSEGVRLRTRLLDLATRLRDRLEEGGLSPAGHGTPIVSLAFHHEQTATRIHEELLRDELLVWPFRPPTVADGTSLLRVSLTADHTSDQVDRVASQLLRAAARHAERDGSPA